MQELLVIIIVSASAAYLGRRFYLQLRKKSDCGPTCGCDHPTLTKKLN